MIVLLLFFCSGATALVYEVIWSKYLSLLFGSTIQAQTVVLAVFMGGLALGNRIFGHRADRSKSPLVLYGYLEVAIGLYAFFFQYVYFACDKIFASLGAGLLDHSGLLLLLKGFLSVLLLLSPTILMGGTLPVLASWLQRTMSDAGRRSARFYSVNSFGAVCGSGLAGFILVTWIGLPMTLQLTAIINVLIGITAVGIERYGLITTDPTETAEASPTAVSATNSKLLVAGCLLVALTGAVSMGLEVLASRCLVLLFGASLQAFSIVLMAFILGIAIGSAVIASPKISKWPYQPATVALVLGAAAWIGLVVFKIEDLVEIYRTARNGLGANAIGYRFYQIICAAFSFIVLGLPAAALGSVLPLWIRAVSGTTELGQHVGRLLTWNTLGAVGGVLFTGFVLMPQLGLRGSFTALALLLTFAAITLAWMQMKPMQIGAACVVGGFLIVVTATGSANWRLVFSSGVFRRREYEDTTKSIRELRKTTKLLFYEDAADATVSVEKSEHGVIALRINGKVDASSYGDLSSQLLIAHLPLMMRPESTDVFVLGMGSGVSAGAVLGHPIEHLVVAENCAPVLRAARFFDRWNNGIFTNSRAQILEEDARTVLKLSPRYYDVIIAEPSNPWTVGVGSVFSRDFYQIAASRLKPGGIMSQWFHVYEMSDTIVEMVVRTFGSVFPNMEIWETCKGDVVMLGSDTAWKSDPEVYERIFERARPRADMDAIGLTNSAMILARQLASQRTAFAVAGPGRIQSDDFPVLEYEAPQAFYVGQRAQRICQFDERTIQARLASPQKQAYLAVLSDDNLESIFGGRYDSMNSDLQSYVQVLYQQRAVPQFPCYGGGITLPCIFEPNRRAPMQPPPWAATNDIARSLFESEVALQSSPEDQKHGEAQILEILDRSRDYHPDESCWSASYYAGVAAKAALSAGDSDNAKNLVLRGLQMDPSSPDLQYLARILIHLGFVKADDVPKAAWAAQ